MAGLPPLRALRYFQQAALHNSFSLAAQSLNVTHSAISHQIKQLEEWLGKPLFIRANGRVQLTADGERLKVTCARAFSDIETTCEKISLRHNSSLTVSSAPSFLSQWLIPRISDFSQLHPAITLNFQTHMDVDKVRGDQTDILILSHEQSSHEDIAATLITVDYIGPVCSANFAQPVSYDTDFTTLPLLHADTKRHAWAEWAEKTGARGDFWAGRYFDNLTLGIQAARNGLGLMITPQILVKRELEEGTLVAPVGFAAMDRATWMMVKQSRKDEPEIALFRQWLLAEAAGE
ncbi:DNA-binding transcriptional LysR family regulator [Erwinia toletana]|uniref:DNA-binding transcriptional LysR family regulator n=1 Tax=Winslowiella toletana TaxID=92490 RepID=A0ABS4PE19_9GAMM|nr:LysR substrate-binding domain-containing protein [Winslowiella toletana]MBP2170188.1 DNA-binding transcriptional LysR family regulator [Winslowiella toletana]